MLPLCQPLEPRRLLSATAYHDGNAIVVRGGDGDDYIRATIHKSSLTFTVGVTVTEPDGTPIPGAFGFDVSEVNRFRFFLGDGDDQLFFHASSGGSMAPVTVYGGGGDDHISVRGMYRTRAYGGAGDDNLWLDASASVKGRHRGVLYGGAGNDDLTGSGGRDLIVGGDGNDRLTGGNRNDVLHGGLGDDTLVAGHGDDLLFGNAGTDHFVGGTGYDRYADADSDDDLDFNPRYDVVG
ncbi:MAG: hypothetical protein AAF743_07725 [Planctomycetota bacterium]